MSGIGTSVLYQAGVFVFNFISPYPGDGGWESLTCFLVKSFVFTDIKDASLIKSDTPLLCNYGSSWSPCRSKIFVICNYVETARLWQEIEILAVAYVSSE